MSDWNKEFEFGDFRADDYGISKPSKLKLTVDEDEECFWIHNRRSSSVSMTKSEVAELLGLLQKLLPLDALSQIGE